MTTSSVSRASTSHEAVIIVHGGAGARAAVASDMADFCRTVVEHAMRTVLRSGGSALDAVVEAVRLLEDDPRFNAGTGAELTEDGYVELDASVMDGWQLSAGAVAALPPFRNPIAIARAALDDGRHVLYAGKGAFDFATRAGFEPVTKESLITPASTERLERALLRRGDNQSVAMSTVGAVAIDSHGHVAAATSTGGTTAQHRGRIGDSPVIGAGTYADDEYGACSATGSGEAILRACLAHDAVTRMRGGGDASVVVLESLNRFSDRFGGKGGLICLDASGRAGIANNTTAMPWACARAGSKTDVGW